MKSKVFLGVFALALAIGGVVATQANTNAKRAAPYYYQAGSSCIEITNCTQDPALGCTTTGTDPCLFGQYPIYDGRTNASTCTANTQLFF